MNSTLSNMRIVKALLYRDLIILSKTIVDNLIDTSIIVVFTYLLYGYLLPLMGMSEQMVAPVFMGVIILVIINITYDRALRDANDFAFIHFIDYQRTLPLPKSWLLAKYVISYAIDLFLASCPVLLFGRILFARFLDLSHANYVQFGLMYFLIIVVISTTFFCEALAVPFSWFRENTFPRLVIPATLLGCIYYPWQKVGSILPVLSKFFLLNPVVYMVEGLRSSLLGSDVFIPGWICIVILTGVFIGNSILISKVAQKRLNSEL